MRDVREGGGMVGWKRQGGSDLRERSRGSCLNTGAGWGWACGDSLGLCVVSNLPTAALSAGLGLWLQSPVLPRQCGNDLLCHPQLPTTSTPRWR